MPELPDIEAYVHALTLKVVGKRIERVRIASAFLLRTFEPPVESVEGRCVARVRRLGKRIVLEVEGELFLVLHLMIAGRLQWRDEPVKMTAKGLTPSAGKITQGVIGFEHGTLLITEASPKKRASLHVVRGEASLREHDPGGLELLDRKTTAKMLGDLLRCDNRTIKRALTDPRVISGVGNAFSDEILHAAGVSPIMLTGKLGAAEEKRLLQAARQVLERFTALLCERFEKKFPGPGDVTAFRPEFAAHGKFGEPCPVCGTKIARIVRAENEMNYCPGCQTGGKLLADRSMSRLLGEDWGKEGVDPV